MMQRFWKFDMFLESFMLGACTISNLKQSYYKNVYPPISILFINIKRIDCYLIKQQTPNPTAQFPDALPIVEHSLGVMHVPSNWFDVVHWLFKENDLFLIFICTFNVNRI